MSKKQEKDQLSAQQGGVTGVATQWTFRVPPTGEVGGEWLYASYNPECPIEFLTLKKSVVPKMPAEVVITLTVIPRDPPKQGEMPLSSEGHMERHAVHERLVDGSRVPRGKDAGGVRYEPPNVDIRSTPELTGPGYRGLCLRHTQL